MKIGPLKKYEKRRGKDEFEPRKVKVKGEVYWQVHFPRTWDKEKNAWVRRRETRKDHQDAEILAQQARIQAKNEGTNSFLIPDHLRREALAAADVLEPFGASIVDAANFYAKHLAQENKSEKVSVAVKEYIGGREKDPLSSRYLKDLRVRLNRFSQAFGDHTVAGMTAAEINTWLRGFKPMNRNTFRLRLSALFNYAIERKWCQQSPLSEVKKVKPKATPIEVLTPEEFARLLEQADKVTLPYWLLGGFAGLRRAEIERLEWNDIHFDLSKYRAFTRAVASGDKEAIAKAEKDWRASALVEVPALKAKTASRRFVQIQDNLAAWLEPYIGSTGKICPANLRKVLETDRANTGIWLGPENEEDAPKIERSGKRKPWPSNGLRHSFASYHLAHFKNAALLALELGHTDQDLIFRHYRELVKPEQAEKWWNIRPAELANLMTISA